MKYAFDVAMISVFGEKSDLVEMEGVKSLYHRLEMGYNSMPLDLPGTPFNKAMKVLKLYSKFSYLFFCFFVFLGFQCIKDNLTTGKKGS